MCYTVIMTETETCRRCHSAPGTERWYVPDALGASLSGVQVKFSAKRTFACDPCWEPFAAYVAAREAGEAEVRPEYHA